MPQGQPSRAGAFDFGAQFPFCLTQSRDALLDRAEFRLQDLLLASLSECSRLVLLEGIADLLQGEAERLALLNEDKAIDLVVVVDGVGALSRRACLPRST